jgi:DHA2 family multidrug resistance protein-like MFS transporter
MSEREIGAAARAGRREWIGLGVLLLPALLVSMDMMVLYFAVPFISHDLKPTGTQQLWIRDIYGFLLAGMLVTMGSIGDRIGRRRLLMIGAAAFGGASVAAAYSGSAAMLIATRALLGVAGATLAPSTLALIRNMFHDPRQRKTAIATWTAGFSGGAALGPIVGGLLLDHFWWGSVFLINVPAMVLLLVAGPILLPEFRDPAPGRFDPLSVLLSLGAVLPVIYGIKQLAVDGVGTVPVLSVAVGTVLGLAFVLRQRALTDPMIDVTLFRYRAYSGSLCVNIVAAFIMAGFGLFSTQYLQLVYGLSPLAAGLWSMPAPLSVGVAAGIATALSKSVRPGYLVSGGLVMMAAGLLVMTRVQTGSPLALGVTGATVMAAGMGVAVTLLADLILSTAPPERAGAAAALSETGNELGGSLGIAVLGTIGAAVYRHHVDGAIPSGVPAGARHAAHETLGGATAAAQQLPGRSGGTLLNGAQHAFMQGMHLTAATSAAIVVVAAVLAAVVLRPIAVPAAKLEVAEPEPAAVN